jgi:hypothetical protein
MTEQSSSATWPDDTAERISAARQRGASFETIAKDFGVSFAAVRNKAIASASTPPRRGGGSRRKRTRSSAPIISRMSMSRSPPRSSAGVGARSGSESSIT